MKIVVLSFLLALLFAFASGANIIGYWGCNPGGHASTTSQLQNAINKGYNVIVYAFYDVDASGGLNQDRMYFARLRICNICNINIVI